MRLILVAVALLGTTSCSLVLPADAVQCEVAEDCAARGFPADTLCEQQLCVAPPFDPIWGCLGHVEEPMITSGEVYTQSWTILDVLTNLPPAGLTARLCSGLDLNCDSPIIDDLTLDADNKLTYEVPAGLIGYIEIDATDMMPALIPFGPVIADTAGTTEQIHLLRTVIVESVARAAGVEMDPTKGHMLGLLASCEGFGRAGLTYSYEPATGFPFYTIANSPDAETDVTDESGRFGVFNLEPGFVTFTSTIGPDGQFVGEKRTLMRPGIMTYLGVAPSPI